MDGTALYQTVSVIYIAQLNNISLSCIDLAIISVITILASIGTGSVSTASLPTILVVLEALDIPTAQVSLIFTADWFLSRLRTAVNVWGILIDFFIFLFSKLISIYIK